MTEMYSKNKSLSCFELVSEFLSCLKNENNAYLVSVEQDDLQYSLLEQITSSFFYIMTGQHNLRIDFVLVPIDETKFPQNWEYKNQFKYDILPELVERFSKEHASTLIKFESKQFIPIDYQYPEKIEKNYDTIFFRVVWQSIEYWAKQTDMNLEEKIICYEKDLMSIMLGNELIPKNMMVPLMREDEKIYKMRNSEPYTTTLNYNLLNQNSDIFITGLNFEDLLFQFKPDLDIEKMYRDKYILEQSLNLNIKKENTSKIKI
jgi:hypothetical protein